VKVEPSFSQARASPASYSAREDLLCSDTYGLTRHSPLPPVP
jgi:hypothetical protein